MTSVDERLLSVPLEPGETISDYRELLLASRSLIDVRAPIEFDKGAFPHAINLPLMNDEERRLIGICYKEQGQEAAIALGAQLVTPELQGQRVEHWRTFADAHPDACLYCFRGGLRSRISQQWLADAGIHIPLIKGGYKALRSFLISELDRLCAAQSFILIGGRTGNGKTLLLEHLGSTVDLEALANHRGSSFGGMPQGQPRNIDFENALTVELMRLESHDCFRIFLEDEARLIGRVCIPDRLRQTMQAAPIYILQCDMPQRIDNCFDDYVTDLLQRYLEKHGASSGFDAFAEHHRQSLDRIRKRFGGDNWQRARTLLDGALSMHRQYGETTEYRPFIEMLLRDYYDPMYDYQLSQKSDRIVFKGTRDEILEKVQVKTDD
ncbi:MAG: tRNA 2-selenouridine(34) synthase MnmH [Granulosicoccus sp.]